MFFFRSQTRERLDRLERLYLKLSIRMTDMDNDLKAKWDALKDVISAAESAMDSLKKAADWLRTRPDSDEESKAMAAEMDAKTKELADKIAAVAASGDVS